MLASKHSNTTIEKPSRAFGNYAFVNEMPSLPSATMYKRSLNKGFQLRKGEKMAHCMEDGRASEAKRLRTTRVEQGYEFIFVRRSGARAEYWIRAYGFVLCESPGMCGAAQYDDEIIAQAHAHAEILNEKKRQPLGNIVHDM